MLDMHHQSALTWINNLPLVLAPPNVSVPAAHFTGMPMKPARALTHGPQTLVFSTEIVDI